MEKSQEIYIDHLARLGVISHVSELAGPPQEAEVEPVPEEPELKGKEEDNEKKVWDITVVICAQTVSNCFTA